LFSLLAAITDYRPNRKKINAIIKRAKMNVPRIKTHTPTAAPVPTNITVNSCDSSLKSTPFMATVTSVISADMSAGSSEILGVKHRIVVLLINCAGAVPNLPNLHLREYSSSFSEFSPGGGIGCQNLYSLSAVIYTSVNLPT